MKKLTPYKIAWLSALLLPASLAFAQDDSSEDDIVYLSPFIVQGGEEAGYQATSTLAGTRIKTDLGDLPNSITVATEELMDDLNVTDATSLLPYLGNIETSGVDGTFQNASEGRIRNPENNNRIRGLASADSSRNYMPTSISFDSYNTERVTVNRGPNSILFGLGSPGGIIDSSVITPRLFDATEIELTIASFNSNRLNFDVERVLIEDKLGIRIAGLRDRQKWRQDFTYEDDDRLTMALLFKPFEKNGNLRLSYEKGEIDARRPRQGAPQNAFTRWWEPPFNKITHDPGNVNFNTVNRDLLRVPGSWFWHPALVYENDAPEASRANMAWEDSRTGNQERFQSYTAGLTMANQWYQSRTAAALGVEYGRFYSPNQVVDRSIYDWVEHHLAGPNSNEWEDFDVLNLSYDQSWDYRLGSFGFEVSYMDESMERSWFDIMDGGRGYNMNIDINTTLNWGAPNPNFGRAYFSSTDQRQQNNFDREVKRGTAYYDVDFKETVSGFLGGLLGRHTGTLFAQEYEITSDTISARSHLDAAYLLASKNLTDLTSDAADARVQVYFGPSLANLSSPVGANLPGIQNQLTTSSTTGWYWNNNAVGDGSGNGGWETHPAVVSDVRNDASFYNSIDGQSLTRQFTESQAYVHQVYLFDQDWIVGTYGRRTDKVNSFGSSFARFPNRLIDLGSRRLNSDPTSEFEATTESLGAVVKVPDFIPLPEGTSLQFHWGESENFEIAAPRITVFGDPIAPPQGTTEDYGFTLGLFENKFQVKFNWYDSASSNVSADGAPGFLIEMDRRLYQYNSQEVLDAAGYVGPPEFYKELTNWQIVPGPTRSGFTVSQDFPSEAITDTQSTASKGQEIDLIYNPTSSWRIMLNLAKQTANRSDISPNTVKYLALRIDEWTNPNNPASSLLSDESNEPVSIRILGTLNNINSNLAQEGLPVSELREWRANLVTNYNFDPNSRLGGLNIGGALRWEDEKSVGFPITDQVVDGQTLELPDLTRPYYDDTVERLDLWVGYQMKILDEKVDWSLQLNIANALSGGDVLTSGVQPNGDTHSVTWREGRTFRLRSTFSF